MSSHPSGDCPARCASSKPKATPQVLLRSREANEAKNNMVALPGQLFYSTQIPVCLWFLTKSKGARTLLSASGEKEFIRDRKKQTLFIDARKLGTLIDRVHRELTDADLEKITSTYHAWRSDCSVVPPLGGSGKDRLKPGLQYADVPGFCKSATTAEIAANLHQSHILTTLRDTLLPKLLSGELSVTKAVISSATE